MNIFSRLLSRPIATRFINCKSNNSDLQTGLTTVFSLLILTTAFAINAFAQTVITPNNLDNWSRADTRTGGNVRLITDGTAPAGTGALRLTTDNTTAAKAQFINLEPAAAPISLSSVTALSYQTKQVSASFANGTASFQLAVYLEGTPASFTNLVYEPYNNGETITNNTWQTWNPLTEDFWSSSTFTGAGSCAVTAGAGGPPFYTLATLVTNCPNAVVVAYGVNVGSFNQSYNIEVDSLNFNGTTYDFDPASVVSISPAGSPTALDNDYTRINNPIQLIENGATLTLGGIFDWAETNAAASWVLGSDGQTGAGFDGDDYSILAPGGLNGVTVTASALGAATIQGPGDLAAISLEGVFQFYSGGTNQNWTISNLRLLDIDNPIGFYFAGGGVHVYDGTQIINNYIRMPQDLNAIAAPGDSFQNIGLHYAFGDNILISGNTFDVPGDSLSDTSDADPANHRFATNVVMQSNTSGGAYEGLQITNNTINVLNAQSADPGNILGIWENGNSHTKNITVSGNQFINQAAGNDPALNRQSAFRVTSHSSISSTVTFSNNRVEGANKGFEWLPARFGADFSTHEPVILTGNTVLNGETGFFIESMGKADMSFNRIVGNSVAAVNNVDGVVNAENNWWGCNFGPGAGGTDCAGTANGTIGTVTATDWLTLTTVAPPNLVAIGGSIPVTSKLTINSSSVDTSGSGNVLNGTPATFAGTNGTVAPPGSVTTAGVTGTSFTATSGTSGSAATTIDGQTVNTLINFIPACPDIITDSTTTPTGVPKDIAVRTTDLTTRGVISVDFTFTFDPAVISFAAVPVTSGSVWSSAGPVVTYHSPSAGVLNVSVYGSNTTPEAVGAGSLIDLHFDVIGPIGSTSPLAVSNFLYNGGLQCITPPSNGTLTVISGTITGQVSYGNPAASTEKVPNVLLNAPGTPLVSGTTDVNGNYSLSGFGPGSYTVTPAKARYAFGTSSASTQIFSNDAALIAQHVVAIVTLTSEQLAAAKVSGTPGPVSSFDAALISQWIVSINPTNPLNNTGRWIFTPPSVNHGVVNADAVQNYTAILLGDVNGSWTNQVTNLVEPLTAPTKESVNVSVPTMKGSVGSSLVVPFSIDNLKDRQVDSYQFDIEYDPEVLKAGEIGASIAGTNSEGLTVVSNSPKPGLLKVVVYGAWAVSGDGVYVNLNFSTVGRVGSSTPLTIRGFRINNGADEVYAEDGEVTLAAANNTIRGKLYGSAASKMTVSNARVTLTDSTGEARTVVTGSFGSFEFGDLDANETYTISVEAGRHRFTPVTVTMTGNVVDLDLTADQ